MIWTMGGVVLVVGLVAGFWLRGWLEKAVDGLFNWSWL